MWYIYFLEPSNGDIYVGSTNDLKRRKQSHDKGIAAVNYVAAHVND